MKYYFISYTYHIKGIQCFNNDIIQTKQFDFIEYERYKADEISAGEVIILYFKEITKEMYVANE